MEGGAFDVSSPTRLTPLTEIDREKCGSARSLRLDTAGPLPVAQVLRNRPQPKAEGRAGGRGALLPEERGKDRRSATDGGAQRPCSDEPHVRQGTDRNLHHHETRGHKRRQLGQDTSGMRRCTSMLSGATSDKGAAPGIRRDAPPSLPPHCSGARFGLGIQARIRVRGSRVWGEGDRVRARARVRCGRVGLQEEARWRQDRPLIC